MTSLSAALFPVIAAICLGGLLGRTTDLFKGPALSGLVSTVGIPALLLHSTRHQPRRHSLCPSGGP